MFIPPGVAHGFASLTDLTLTYLVDSYYNPEDELGVAWDDPEIGADWGVTDPILSARDQANPRRADLDPSRRPYARRCAASRIGAAGTRRMCHRQDGSLKAQDGLGLPSRP